MNRPDGSIIELGAGHSGVVTGLMVRAFASYGPLQFIVDSSSGDRERELASIHRFWLDIYLQHKWPVVGYENEGGIEGVALITPPSSEADPAVMETLIARLRAEVGEDIVARLAKYEDETESMLPEMSYHYIGILAVEPARQRTGVGGRLLRYADEMVEANLQSAGIYLNTEEEANVEYYRQHGYDVVGRKKIFDFTSWCMFKSR